MTTPEQRARLQALEEEQAQREQQHAQELEAERQRQAEAEEQARQQARETFHRELLAERERLARLSDAELKRESERARAALEPKSDYKPRFAKEFVPPTSPQPVQTAEATEPEPMTRLQRVAAKFSERTALGIPPSKALESAFQDEPDTDYELLDDQEPDIPARPVVLGPKLKRLLGLQ